MKFYLSFAISILIHILIIGLLSRTFFSQEIPPRVFSVDIVPPPEILSRVPEQTIPQPQAKRKEQPPEQVKPMPPISGIKPENMQGGGDSKAAAEDTAPSDTPGSAALDETSPADIAEEGFFLARESSAYDREKIRERAGEQPDGKDVIPFNTSDLKYRGYMRMLKEQIESIWQYPEGASSLGVSGDLDIRFVINKDGTLGDVEIMRPSGYRGLDKAAVKAIEDAFPFWPLPDDWEGDEYIVEGHFVYLIGGVYVF